MWQVKRTGYSFLGPTSACSHPNLACRSGAKAGQPSCSRADHDDDKLIATSLTVCKLKTLSYEDCIRYLQSRNSQVAAALVALVAIATTDLHMHPGMQRAMVAMTTGISVLFFKLSPRVRTTLICVLGQILVLVDLWSAIYGTPTQVIAKMERLQSASHALVLVSLAAGVWLGTRPPEEIGWRNKLLAVGSYEGLCACIHVIVFARTGSTEFLHVAPLYFHLPYVVTVLVVHRLVHSAYERAWLRWIVARLRPGAHEHKWQEEVQAVHQPPQIDLELQLQGAAPQMLTISTAAKLACAYQKLSRLIDYDAVWETLEDVEGDTWALNAKLRPCSLTTGASVVVHTDLASVMGGREGDLSCATTSWHDAIVRFESATADGFGLPGQKPLQNTTVEVPPLVTLTLTSTRPAGAWRVHGQTMQSILYTVAFDTELCV